MEEKGKYGGQGEKKVGNSRKDAKPRRQRTENKGKRPDGGNGKEQPPKSYTEEACLCHLEE